MTASRRVFIGAFGDPGHAFPAISLAKELAGRGIEVVLETAEPWRPHVESVGARFIAAPEFDVFPTKGRHLKPYEAVTQALETTRPAVAEASPDIVVNDILTLAPALAAELEGIPRVTLVPHLNPVAAPGSPPFGLAARVPTTVVGRSLWRVLSVPVERGLVMGMNEYDDLRRRVGLKPKERIHGAMSETLVIVGTFPQLEGARALPANYHVTGPLFWEPASPDVDVPAGNEPLVMVAPSTAQDPGHRLLQAALEGLADLPVRVIATWNRRPLERNVRVGANTNLVEWLSYSRTIPLCAAVISHAGHGTLARTLQAGAVPVLSPWSGDQFENAARVAEAGIGVRLPRRLVSARTIGLAVELALSSEPMRRSAAEVARWSAANDGAARAADLVLAAAAAG